MNPDPITGWAIAPALALIGLSVLAALIALTVFGVGALLRAHRRFSATLDTAPRAWADRDGSTWDQQPDGLYDMRDTQAGVYQGWTRSQIDRVHGPLVPAVHISDVSEARPRDTP